jgi:ABC-type Na+ efflux pump permease subunit
MSAERISPRHSAKSNRILLAVNVLILILLGVGVSVFLVGRVSNDIRLSTIAAYVIVIGIMALVTRIVYWLVEAMVRRGAEAMRDADLTPSAIIFLGFGQNPSTPCRDF